MRKEKYILNTLYVIPLFSKYEILPKAYTRLIGKKPFFSYTCELLLQLNAKENAYIITDIVEIKDIIEDMGIRVKLTDSQCNSSKLQSVLKNSILDEEILDKRRYEFFSIINPNALLIDAQMIKTIVKDFADTDFKAIVVLEGSAPSFDLDHFMRESLLSVLRREYLRKQSDFTLISSTVKVPIITDKNDWILTDRILKQKRIIFRADGYTELGMGHIYNCITLAYSLYEHEILLVLHERSTDGIKKVKEAGLQYKIIKDDTEIDGIIKEFKPDIWVNDCLDTNIQYINFLKSKVRRVVTIEDLGEGTNSADAVINALYDDNMLSGRNVYNGWKYVCLRDEFQIETQAPFSEEVHHILIMSGGTDPANINKTVYPIIEEISEQYPYIEFYFVVGIGYDAEKNGIITNERKRIYVYSNVQRVTKYMKKADLAITSQGRTIFELASMCVPSIVLSQNERETKHNFAQMENGFLNLGMGKNIDGIMLKNTLAWLINTPPVRRNMYDLMKKCRLKEGLDRVKEIILGKE